ncbi:uncharacterized protein LOC108108214 isoform X2 [Drosophila eugracilis]|nr:uncharacterized protein LOC108108214 isoform X2 [Drosophila eugracilis]
MVYVNQYDSIEGWDNFVQNSRLRPGLMVTPNRGVYKLIDGEVELNAYCIPGRLRTKMLSRDRCISAEDVQEALIRPTESITNLKYDGFFGLYRVQLGGKLYDSVLYQLLVSGHRKSVIEAENLSDSLTLFTHGINNSRLSSLMIKDQNSSVVLGNYLKRVFDTIFWKTNRIEGKVDLIRSANEVPTKNDLYLFFHRKLRKQYNRCFSVEKNTIKVEDLGSALRNNIENQENIEILITVMTKHLKPEMIQLILQLTQSFMESTREELWQLLKYHISTDIVLYQVIRIVLEDFSNLDPNEVKEQSSYILGHIKARFVSYNPNSPPELLKKCRKCVGYYHISKIDLSAQ